MSLSFVLTVTYLELIEGIGAGAALHQTLILYPREFIDRVYIRTMQYIVRFHDTEFARMTMTKKLQDFSLINVRSFFSLYNVNNQVTSV